MLRLISNNQIRRDRKEPIDADTLLVASKIVADVKEQGEQALRQYAEKFDGLEKNAPLTFDKRELKKHFDALPKEQASLLERVGARIRTFAEAQKNSLRPVELAIAGGKALQVTAPVQVAGCYAPGGRYPLPSSMLMTAVTAQVAGVETVVAASPRPAPITLAAAHIAGAELFLPVGGAQAIAALAFGIGGVPAADVIVGPGNRYVTAAKKIVSGFVGIDFLAGPSELLVIADESANPEIIAADLLAQAEHDLDALPTLISVGSKSLIDEINGCIQTQLEELATRDTAKKAIQNGFAVIAEDFEDAAKLANEIAPEHLQLMLKRNEEIIPLLKQYGALFVGELSAEVLGDYGAGPNHVLPTSSNARFTGGLSVFTFLRIRTSLVMDNKSLAEAVLSDCAALAELEGLEGHKRAATIRM